MKIDKTALGTPSFTDLVPTTGKKEEDSWTKFEKILGGLNELLTHYTQIQAQKQGQSFTGKDNPSNPPPNKQKGEFMEKLLDFLIQFTTNLEKQGMGDKPIGEVIVELPLPVKAVTQLLHAVKAKIKITGGL